MVWHLQQVIIKMRLIMENHLVYRLELQIQWRGLTCQQDLANTNLLSNPNKKLTKH